MNTTPPDELVLKQDVLRWVKTPKMRREQLLDEFERYGLPGLKFAELVRLNTRRLRRGRNSGYYAAGKLTTAKKSMHSRP